MDDRCDKCKHLSAQKIARVGGTSRSTMMYYCRAFGTILSKSGIGEPIPHYKCKAKAGPYNGPHTGGNALAILRSVDAQCRATLRSLTGEQQTFFNTAIDRRTLVVPAQSVGITVTCGSVQLEYGWPTLIGAIANNRVSVDFVSRDDTQEATLAASTPPPPPLPEDDVEDVTLILFNEDTNNPHYMVAVRGEPVAKICLEDQQKGASLFVQESYPRLVLDAVKQFGLRPALDSINARYYKEKAPQKDRAAALPPPTVASLVLDLSGEDDD